MTHFGLYEPVVESALEHVRPAPWSVDDLHESEAAITPEQCRSIYPHCRPQDIIDWLHALTPASKQELIDHLNAERKAAETHH